MPQAVLDLLPERDDLAGVEDRRDRRESVAERRPAEVAERPRDQEDDQEARERDGLDRVLDQLDRERRAHHRRAGDLRVRAEAVLQRLRGLRQLIGKHLRRTDFDSAGDALRSRLGVTERREERLEIVVGRARQERQLEQRAAFELDAWLEAADRKEEDAGHDEERRKQEVPPLALDDMEEHPESLTNPAPAPPARGGHRGYFPGRRIAGGTGSQSQRTPSSSRLRSQ